MKLLTTDVVETLRRRASCRAFASEDVPDDLLGPLLQAATRAPTSFSLQPYALVTVRSAESRAVLAAAAGGSVPLTAAPVAVVICTDLARVERITGMPGELAAGQHDDAMLSSVIDASMVGLCLTLAAESAGLGAVMIGAIRNDPGSVARLLALPAGVFPLFAVCVGWPAETPPVHPRLAPRSVIHPERYRAAIAAGAELHDPDGLPAGLAGVAAWQAQVGKAARKLRRRRSLPWQGEGGEEGGRI